ncbi:transglycosylase domain-containing protein [Lentibacillus sp. N15]|uniref:transglycosylase domain-containing protein n=1 Tax=Lentibacillus songyuanensis TaxID=3136161 RepID=UPI0031BB839A
MRRSDRHKETRSDRHKKRGWKLLPRKLKWSIGTIGLLLILTLIGYSIIIFGGYLIVDKDDLVLDAATTVETKDGNVISSIYHENRTLIDRGDIPDHVKNAFIAIEDRRFYTHRGIDIKSAFRAVYKDIIAMGKVEGASTITQQLAKNLFLTNDKTWMRKTKEAMAAIYLERHYSKDEILELYLNQMYFGKGAYGIETASQLYFSKSASELDLSEAALLAGMAKGPNGYSPIDHPEKALTRRNIVLKAMDDTGMISTKKRVQAQEKKLGLHVKEEKTNHIDDSYVDLVMKEAADEHELSINELKRGGYRIIVNLDETTQQIAYDLFQNEDYFPGNTKGVQAAFVMMDQQEGGIVAAIGGRDYQLGDWNRVAVKRQPGSTMKPIAVYGPALMQKKFQAYTLIPDQKIDYKGYTATNYDGQYDGAVSIYQALVASKNAPAVWLLNNLGIAEAKGYLKNMGISLPDKGLSIALGGLKEGLTPIDMMQSYRTFAHNGEVIPAHTINQLYDREQQRIYQAKPSSTKVFNPQVAWNMTEILASAVEHGTAQAGDYAKALAGKTGSTQHPYVDGAEKDAWFVGYTPQYVSALWMGYDNSDADHYLTGGSEYPTMLTKAILTELDKQKSLTASFAKPKQVEALPKPIVLPENTQINAAYTFGGLRIVKGKITWTAAQDDRVEYHIYQKQEGKLPKLIGTTKGDEFTVTDLSLFGSSYYFVVPYDPLTKTEGKQSNLVELSL